MGRKAMGLLQIARLLQDISLTIVVAKLIKFDSLKQLIYTRECLSEHQFIKLALKGSLVPRRRRIQ